MSNNCYQIACDQAINEIAELDEQIQRLSRRKELLEKLLEPLKLLLPESDSAAIPATVSEGSNRQFSDAAIQMSPVVVFMESGAEPEAGAGERATGNGRAVSNQRPEAKSGEGTGDRAIAHEDVADLAYHFWTERGQVHGHHVEDWFRAADELRR